MLMYKVYCRQNNEDKVIILRETKKDYIERYKQIGVEIKNVVTLYPVASWERNQHIFYNLIDRMANIYHETGTKEDYERWQEAQRLAGLFDTNPRWEGVVYAEYQDYKNMKDYIGGYILRHDRYAV